MNGPHLAVLPVAVDEDHGRSGRERREVGTDLFPVPAVVTSRESPLDHFHDPPSLLAPLRHSPGRTLFVAGGGVNPISLNHPSVVEALPRQVRRSPTLVPLLLRSFCLSRSKSEGGGRGVGDVGSRGPEVLR